jgi:hypothetical protein
LCRRGWDIAAVDDDPEAAFHDEPEWVAFLNAFHKALAPLLRSNTLPEASTVNRIAQIRWPSHTWLDSGRHPGGSAA